MKKSEIAGIKPATVEEIAAKAAEQIRYQQALTSAHTFLRGIKPGLLSPAA